MTQGSRLDQMLARLAAQKAAIEAAARVVGDLPGPVLEIGLGKGRTYSHLRVVFPDRAIFAFDRDLHAPPDCTPPDDRLVLGDFRTTLPAMRGRLGDGAALAHADFGSEDRARDAAQAAWLAPLIDALLTPGAVIVADRPMTVPRWRSERFDSGAWPYFLWRAAQ